MHSLKRPSELDRTAACRHARRLVGAGAAILALIAVRPRAEEQAEGATAPDGFALAEAPRAFAFPRDHGDHPRYKTEWWYFTGALASEDGEVFGFQATWFRSALVAVAAERASPLAARDLMFFHGAVTDVERGSFLYEDAVSRRASNWASASEETLDVRVFAQRAFIDAAGRWRITFTVEGRRVELVLDLEREPLLHGETPGLSRKGPKTGQASYYVSQTRLSAEGTIEREPGGDRASVRGRVWFDHEFGSNQLPPEQVGWDWFSVALDDGADVMAYSLRNADGTVASESSGTVRLPDGSRHHLPREAFTLEVTAHWRSPRSNARYPARWRLSIEALAIELEIEPLLADQELMTERSTGVTYWEGLCRFRGTREGREVEGRGYVELVGYAGPFGARL